MLKLRCSQGFCANLAPLAALLLLIAAVHFEQSDAAKSSEHVVLYAWPGGRSHGFIAATIAKRLATDHAKVSLLVATMDLKKLAPIAGPDVNVVSFPVVIPRTMAMVGVDSSSRRL